MYKKIFDLINDELNSILAKEKLKTPASFHTWKCCTVLSSIAQFTSKRLTATGIPFLQY